MIKLQTYEPQLISFEPLTLDQLQMLVAELLANMCQYRPEFSRLLSLQRYAGTRVNELFQPERWEIQNDRVVHVQPQKKNALRVLNFADIGIQDAEEFQIVAADMQRLPKRQYERAFSKEVESLGLWREYENGFTHPSTHLLRHLKIKELAANGASIEYIGSWIGEKNLDNLNYYLDSRFFQ